jgi:hypothetical protein
VNIYEKREAKRVSEQVFNELNYLIAALGVIFNNMHCSKGKKVAVSSHVGGYHA